MLPVWRSVTVERHNGAQGKRAQQVSRGKGWRARWPPAPGTERNSFGPDWNSYRRLSGGVGGINPLSVVPGCGWPASGCEMWPHYDVGVGVVQCELMVVPSPIHKDTVW